MQKKEIKGRRPNNKKVTTKKSTNTKNIKKRIVTNPKEDNQIKLILLISFIAIVLLSYFTLGTFFALLTGFGIGIIVGVAKLLDKCKEGKKTKKIIKIILMVILSIGIVCLVGFTIFLIFIKINADPKYVTSKLETQENSEFLDINNEVYAKLGSEMREKVTYDELPEVLIDAIIATEDSRYFQHNGFDAPRFIKASMGQVMQKLLHKGSNAGGASTLTMQVVKNSLTNAYATKGTEGIIRKFEDIYLAIFKLEKDFTKEQIIEYYVNNHYLGGNYYGVQEASEAYFGKSVSELNLSEAATLAGMFKSPIYYSPTVYPEHAETRRKTVLYLMKRHGYITEEEEKIANSIPISSLTSEGGTTQNNKYSGYVDTVVEELDTKYGINPYTTPVIVYTNLDRSKQDGVNSVMNGESYTWINDKVQAGVAVLDSQTGKILAIGNGRNIGDRSANKKGQWNYATKNKRQPGSTAKPLFDYGPGIEYNNWSTYTLFEDEPYTYSNGRSIQNWDGGYLGTLTLRKSLAYSRNIPALKAFQQVDNKKILEFVSNLGMTPEVCSTGYTYNPNTMKCISKDGKSTEDPTRIHEAHSIGAFTGTNPLQMSAAYAAFSNGGYYNEPYSVSKVVYKSNNETKEHNSDNYVVKRKAMSEATAFMISSVLQDVTLNGGNPVNVARKTGTTNYDSSTMESKNLPWDAIRDSWIIGYSTKTVVGLWYGYDFIDSKYCLHNVPASVQKDKIFNALVNSGAMESNREAFKQPDSVVKVGVVMGSNPPKLAGSYTGNVVYEYFKKEYAPEETYVEEKLAAPEDFEATYNRLTKKVNLSWKAVSTSGIDDENYGTFGYNVYFGSTLIGFTEKTSFTYTPTSSPYGTYKVVATYKSYSGIKSESATYKLEEETNDNLELQYTGSTTIPALTGALTLSTSDFVVKNNGSTVSATIEQCTPNEIKLTGRQTITCTIKYKNKTETLTTTINVTKEQESETQ